MGTWKVLWLLGIMLAFSEVTEGHEGREKRTLPSVDITSMTKWTDTENTVAFCLTVLASQVIITVGWLIVGSLWYVMAISSVDNPSMHKSVMSLEFMLGPSYVLDNVWRCTIIFGFLAFSMIMKTILTIGLTNTGKYFFSTSRNDAYNIVTSEKFLRGTTIRAVGNGFFLLIGWSLVAIYAKRKLFTTNNDIGRKRKKRSNFKEDQSPPQYPVGHIIEDKFTKMLSKL